MALISNNISRAIFKSPVVNGLMNHARLAMTKKATEWLMTNGLNMVKKEIMVSLRIAQNDGRLYWDFLRFLTKHMETQPRILQAGMIDGKYYNLTTIPVMFKYDGHVFFAYKSYPKKDDYVNTHTGIVVNMLGRDSRPMTKMVEEMREKDDDDDGINVYRSTHGGQWNHVCEVAPRNFDSVILRKDLKESIIKRINDWIDNEDYYKTRNIAYKLAMIFKGLPGTGKTSIIKAIASSIGYDLYLLNLKHVTDANIMSCIQAAGEDSIIVIEEFDTCGVTARRSGLGALSEEFENSKLERKKRSYMEILANPGLSSHQKMIYQEALDSLEADSDGEPVDMDGLSFPVEKVDPPLTLGGLLTAFDGLIPLDNRIIIMTTNVMDDSKFDPAFLRKGRIDAIYEIPYLYQAEIEEYVKYMYPRHEVPEGMKFKPIAGCDLHGAFLDNKFDFEEFIKTIPLAEENEKE